jgi:DNA polymerase-3 subunit epsilon
MGFDFVAVDFETANASRGSMCAVGAVRVRDGRIVGSYFSLIRPGEGEHFAAGNVRIHGIRPDDVVTAPTWAAAYPRFAEFVGEDVLVGHNARFDVSVLLNTCGQYDIDWPVLDTVCTLQLARATLHIPSYSLPWVAEHLGLEAFDHHDALADARTSAQALLAIADRLGVITFEELLARARMRTVPTWLDSSDAVLAELSSTRDGEVRVGFAGHVVSFTGALSSMTRPRARELVLEQGGNWQDGVTKTTTILVTGDFDPSTFRPGAVYSGKLRKAFERVDAGQALEIITEDDFLTRMKLNEEELRAKLAVSGRKTKVPEWVVAQAGTGPGEDFFAWFSGALRHPEGRARGDEPCVWCAVPIPSTAHWIHRDRHVCGIHCNQRLKSGARRAWNNAGIVVPASG